MMVVGGSTSGLLVLKLDAVASRCAYDEFDGRFPLCL